MQSIYLDNAATSFPKPAGVSDSMKRYLDCVGATINRSVYGRAQEAGLETLGVVDADTWESLRLAAQGLCRECQEG